MSRLTIKKYDNKETDCVSFGGNARRRAVSPVRTGGSLPGAGHGARGPELFAGSPYSSGCLICQALLTLLTLFFTGPTPVGPVCFWASGAVGSENGSPAPRHARPGWTMITRRQSDHGLLPR
eukprot:scaffold55126_cov19-Prasinocladus_malaysianus.AAC.1